MIGNNLFNMWLDFDSLSLLLIKLWYVVVTISYYLNHYYLGRSWLYPTELYHENGIIFVRKLVTTNINNQSLILMINGIH